MAHWYDEDLAYTHDAGFRDYTLRAMPGIFATLNYTFDENSDQVLKSLCQRLYAGLTRGGVIIFDGLVAGQVPPGEVVKSFTKVRIGLCLWKSMKTQSHKS